MQQEHQQFVDFNDVAKRINVNLEDHEKKIKSLCSSTSIVALDEFYRILQQEVEDINSEIMPPDSKPSLKDFEDFFKVIEDYPTNLQKPKKTITRDQSRMNSFSIKNSTITNEPCIGNIQKNSGQIALKCDTYANASETCTEYKNFQQKLTQIKKLLQQKTVADDYSHKLDQLLNFAKQLEKLYMTDQTELVAFTEQENEKIRNLVSDLEKIVFIEQNVNIFYSSPEFFTNNVARISSAVDILAHTLMSINCFNTI